MKAKERMVKTKEVCSNVQELTRRERIAQILSTVDYGSDKTREEVIDSLNRANLPDEEVFGLAEIVTPEYQAKAKAATKEREARRVRESGVY